MPTFLSRPSRRDAARLRFLDEILSFFGGRALPMMAQLAEAGKLSLDDVRELEKTVQRSRRKRKQRGVRVQFDFVAASLPRHGGACRQSVKPPLSQISTQKGRGNRNDGRTEQPSLAIDRVRDYGRASDPRVPQEPRPGPLLAVVQRVA